MFLLHIVFTTLEYELYIFRRYYVCLHCRVSDRGTPIRVLLRATEIVYKQLVIGPGRKMMTLL